MTSRLVCPGGGYTLARSPDEITIRNVLEAVEGPLVVSQCVTPAGCRTCGQTGTCAVRHFWFDMRETLLKMLDGATIQDMLKGSVPQAS